MTQYTPLAGNYVSDGLILRWDAICNTPDGHDPTSKLWYDLSGNGHHATYNANNTIGDTYLQTNGYGLAYVGMSDDEKASYKMGMAEVVIEPDSITRQQVILTPVGNMSYNYLLGAIYCTTTGIIGFTYNFSSTQKGRAVQLLEGKHYYNNNFYRDGVTVTGVNESQTWGNARNYLCAYTAATNNAFQGKIYSLRVYDHMLTDSEIRRNWLEDKRRFGI